MTKAKVSTEVSTGVPTQENEITGFIQEAIKNQLPVETMERLFALREKVKAEKAKEAFTQALADFQSECPEIQKTKEVLNKDGRSVRYRYAPLSDITKEIKKPLSKSGLSYTWDVKNEENAISAIAKITHVLGHFETSTFKVPIDTGGFMTAPQKYASALTFAKRYALVNALGISTGEEDTDATDVGKEPEAKSDKAVIVLRLRALNQKTATKEEVEEAVKRLTSLELKEKNFVDIANRLQAIIEEKNEDTELQK